MVSFGIEFVPFKKIEKLVNSVVEAEKLDFENVWVTDHYNNRNVYVTLASMGYKTQKIKLGVGVTNPYVIHPLWTASAIATLNEVTNGRVFLGIGAGDKATLSTLGIKFHKPLTTIREAVEIMRKLLQGETVNYDGEIFKVKGARLNYKVKGSIPIYIGAQGPKMLKLAGKLGDGVLINASNPLDIKEAVEKIREGEKEREEGKAKVVVYTSFSIDEDYEKAAEKAAEVVSFIVAGSPPLVLEKHEIPLDKAEDIKNKIMKGKILDAFKSVTPEMIEAFSITGTPTDCLKKVREIIEIGVDQLVVGSPVGPKVKNSMRLVNQEIMQKI